MAKAKKNNPPNYAVKLIKIPAGSSFTLYLENQAERVVAGRSKGGETILTLPLNQKGKGKIKVLAKRRNKTMQSLPYSVPVDLDPDKGNIVDLSLPNQNPPQKKTEESPKSLITNELQDKVQNKSVSSGPIKSVTDTAEKSLVNNKLQSAVKKKKAAPKILLDRKGSEINNEKGPKGDNFWDELK